jgi:Tfp pilus assembly protein PilF
VRHWVGWAGSLLLLTCATTAEAPKPAIRPAETAAPVLNAAELEARGSAAWSQGRLDEARSLYQQLRIAKPDNVNAVLALAQIATQQGDWSSAERLNDEALKAAPDSSRAVAGQLTVLARQGRCEEGLRRFASMGPLRGDAGAKLGVVLALAQCERSLGRFDAAETRLREALSTDPENAVILGQLSLVFFEQGNLRLAEAGFTAAMKMAPNDASLHNNLGLVLVRLGDTKRALVAFERALAIDAGLSSALFNAANVSLSFRDFEGAEKYLRRAAKTDGSATVQRALAAALDGQKGKDAQKGREAGEILERLLATAPQDASVICEAGWAFSADKDSRAKAQRFLEQCQTAPGTTAAEKQRIASKLKGLAAQDKSSAASPASGPSQSTGASLIDRLSTETASSDAGVSPP